MTEALSSNIEENFDRFIVEALETGCVWGLEGPEGWALCPSEQYGETDVMPFWSQPEFAKAHCVEDWSVYQPVAVSVEEFMDKWLPGMHEDVYLVGINWDSEMEGMEIEPLDLLEEFENEIS
ncbi:MAG: DUF2750 domain-containing protein [Cellvibrionaceae bacterium]|nr:DUF2750 domain-containing protein [Cellvibrionaceae bacterium]